MKIRNAMLSAVAVIALVAMPVAFAQNHFHGHRDDAGPMGGHFEHMLDHLKVALNLSDDQVKQIQPIFDQLKTQNAPIRQQLMANHQAMVAALVANPNDLTTAQNLLAQQSTLQQTVQSNMLTAASKALNILTPDQRTKLAQLIASHMGKHHE